MQKKYFIFLLLLMLGTAGAKAQKKEQAAIDSFAYYDELFNELEAFLDSLTTPRSFATASIGVSNGYFNYQSQAGIKSSSQLIYMPAVGYYHKMGWGLSASGSALMEGFKNINLYQVAASASYDYLKNRHFMTGLSYTHFFTKENLDFYTSPLTNELYAYVANRSLWFKPSVAVSYGWGSRTHVEEREEKIKLLRGKPLNSTTIIETTENYSDLNVAASVKHDFYWLGVLLDKDHIRFSPQLTFLSGTQRFGFNQVSNYNMYNSKAGINIFQNSEELNLSEESKFKPLSLSARLRGEWAKGIFFIQPQILVDYYIPAKEKNFTTGFAISTGVIL